MNMTKSLTGRTITLTEVPTPGNTSVTQTFTTQVLATCFTFERVAAVEVEVPNHGRRTVGACYITAVGAP